MDHIDAQHQLVLLPFLQLREIGKFSALDAPLFSEYFQVSHLNQESGWIGRVDLNKRKNIGETLAVEWNLLIVW